jgi:hypothetical protein
MDPLEWPKQRKTDLKIGTWSLPPLPMLKSHYGAGSLKTWGSELAKYKLGVQTKLRVGWQGFYFRQGQWWDFSLKLTTHLHLLPRWRMSGAIPPFLQYVFMAWCLVKHRDNFTFYFCLQPTCRPALGSTQALIQIPKALSSGSKRPGHEVDHSLPSSAEVKNAWIYTLIPPYFIFALYLVNYKDNFTFCGSTRG